MTGKEVHSDAGRLARRVVLDLVLSKRDFPTRAFPDAATQAGLDGRDRALARALLAGVIRRRRTLDALFKPFLSRRQVDPAVLWTLRLGLYQRFFMDNVPAYAAFNATLEAAKARMPRGVGFANAVLRAIDRAAKGPEEGPADPAPNRLSENGKVWTFDRPIFADVEQEPETYWGVALSYPDELVRRWFAQVGSDTALARMRHLNGTPPLAVRINPVRSSLAEVQAGLAAAGLEPEPGDTSYSLLVRRATGEVGKLPGFAEGHWSVQDLAAQQAVLLARPAAGERILDYCAAPGGKAFAAWEFGEGRAEVLACDINPARLKKLAAEIQRLGNTVEPRLIQEGEVPAHPAGPWDLVILDVPCTNTGVLGRRPEARWNFSDRDLQRCLQTQRAILKAVLDGGIGEHTRILWSTCSLEPEENQEMLGAAAARFGLEIRASRLFEPSEMRSGGFAAVLSRSP